MITVQTNYPIATDSPDHIMPWGTANDNFSSQEFINELLQNYSEPISFLDLGCSGGQLVIDIHNRGHLSIGLEGSDYSIVHSRANWPTYYNKNLFTCDVTKPYKIFKDNEQVLFDVITAWEVVEHISNEDLYPFFKQVNDNLKPGGIFLASIATHEDVINGVTLHQSVHSQEVWLNEVFPRILDGTTLQVFPYPFQHKVRNGPLSFFVLLRKGN